MNILYTCDNNYMWLMGISMLSLFENNKTVKEINVYLLGENISEDNKLTLKDIAIKYERKCNVIDMPDIDIPISLISTRWPKSAFSRLYAAEMLPSNIDKILYLDCDTIILGCLDYIESISFLDYPVYGVKDCISFLYRKNIGLDKESLYVNGGVLLLSLDKMREMDMSSCIDSFLKKYQSVIHYADQDVLNGVFKGNFGVLPAEFDVMTLEYMYTYDDIIKLRHPINYYEKCEINKAVEKPLIVHFTTNMLNIRPWYINTNHPMAEEFLKYKSISPWGKKRLEEMPQRGRMKDKMLSLLHLLPKVIEVRILGVLHAVIYPVLLRFKAK